jgi:hypothetical protein
MLEREIMLRTLAMLTVSGLIVVAEAHHSPAPFDLTQMVTVEGTVSGFFWANPHVYIDLAVEDEDGMTSVWEIEGAWPASLVSLGWSRDTLLVGDTVSVTGNPGKRPGSHILLGTAVELDGETFVLNAAPGAPISDTSLTDQDRTGLAPMPALAGTWMPRTVYPMVLINPPLSATPGPMRTAVGAEALADGRFLMLDSTEQEQARCAPQRPPLNMAFQEPKQFNVRGDRITIRVLVVGETERTIYLENAPAVEVDEQGLSIGRWEGDALVVSTTFNPRFNAERGVINGVPLGGETRLHERFEISEDRRTLEYTYVVENSEYLVEPFSITTEWAYRPDLEIPTLECDPALAERFLDEL